MKKKQRVGGGHESLAREERVAGAKGRKPIVWPSGQGCVHILTGEEGPLFSEVMHFQINSVLGALLVLSKRPLMG